MTGSGGKASGIPAHRAPKQAMILAQQIMRDAARDGTRPGEMLPPERVMAQRYGTGRGTLREALRLLEYQGVISLKPGLGGGPVLQTPDASHLANTLVILLQLKQAPFRGVIEVRSALEPMISRLAAERMTDDALAELAGTNELMRTHLDNQDLFLGANKRFHDIIAWSSGNPLFGYIVDSLINILDGTVIGIDYPELRRIAIVKAHDEILAALSSRDPGAAEARMREHIDAYVAYTAHKYPEVMDRPLRWDRMTG